MFLHAAIIGAVVWQGVAGIRSSRGGRSGGGREHGGPRVNFFALPAAPAAVPAADIPPTVAIATPKLPSTARIPVDLPQPTLVGPIGTGGGTGGGAGTGTGADTGSAVGSGTGGEGDYILVASPRTAILPPLAKVPGSVTGRTYRVRFWVSAEGRVTRVEVDPPIRDDAYRREFLERMLAYQFYPAQTRARVNVASIVTVPLRIGN